MKWQPAASFHDVLEGLARAFRLGPQLQLAHAGRVDQQAAALRQQDQLAMAGGMAAARIAGAHIAGLQHLLADQGVDQRGLADARGPEQRSGPARAQVVLDHLDAAAAPWR